MMNLWCFYVNESIQLNFQTNSGEYYKLKVSYFIVKEINLLSIFLF